MILASGVGGLYSLTILLDELPAYITMPSKLIVSVIMVLISFNFYRVRSFMYALFTLYFSSLIILGFVVGIYLLTDSKNITINNSVIYFNIGSKELLLCSFIAYIVSSAVIRFYNKKISSSEIYLIEIENDNKTVSLYAFADSGNRLREPFSDYPVIIAKESLVCDLCDSSKIRLIPTKTVNNSSMLKAFRPDKITIRAGDKKEIIQNAYIAMSNEINSDSFSAVINPEILSV